VSATREPIAPPRGLARARLAATLGALVSFGPLSLDLYLPGLPGLGRDLDATASAAQLTLTACLAGLALGQLVAGPLSDRLGRRRPLVGGVVLYAVASLSCAAGALAARRLTLR
jgi:MFS transporter, DHA1 family, multidrug resistance protein